MRFTDNAGQINILYNYTRSGSTKTDYVVDLRGTSSKCKVSASGNESPLLSTVNLNIQLGTMITPTMPNINAGSCPSYKVGTTTSGTAYTITVVGLYSNSVTCE